MQSNLDFFKFLLENDPRMTNSTPDVYPYFGTSTNTAPVMVSVADTQQYAIEPDYAMQDVPLEADNPTYSGRSLGVGTSGGAHGTSGGGSSGTDFRRRRNWPERILNEITGFLHVLSPVGKLLHCSKSSVELTGYTPEELVGRSLTDFLHVDDIDVFIRGFNRAFQTRSQIKMIYRFRKKDESYAVFETIGHPRTDVPGQPPQSFFALAQPYPTRMSGLLDSFLELKMENEWLKQRLREVSAMEQETMDSPSTSQQARFADASNIQRARRLSHAAEAAGSATATTGMHPGIFQAVTEDSNANPLWATADEKATSNEFETLMPLYGQNDLDMPSLPSATGLTSSAHTGASKVVESGDTGGQKWKRRKKNRGVDDYVCADCGTTSSPEWRKGPHGPKTLCNACGLRWAKKSKKKDTNND